jgi:CubicO group peptidase (beta-lactamase class C family)
MKKAAIFLFIISAFSSLLLASDMRKRQEIKPLKTDVNQKELIEELENSIPILMDKARIPGLSIAVIQDGKIMWSKGFGIKNVKTDEKVLDNTVFEAASLTKPFFAYLAMKLVESGELELDRPLIEYVPREYLRKRYIGHALDLEGFRRDWFERITARMVLSHSSGLPHGGPRKPLPVLFEPGTKYRYSADGYLYLQRVIEHLKGEPLREIMRESVIEPLQMKDSSMVWQERYDTQSAVGHDIFGGTEGRFRIRKRAHAGASLYTTARDYARFVLAMMNDVGLKKPTIDKMLTPHVEVDTNVFWSLGFGLEKAAWGTGFWQWGDYGIFRNYIVAYRAQKIGVIYFTNSFNGLSIGPELVSMAIGGGKDFGLAYLDYAQYDSPVMLFAQSLEKIGTDEAKKQYHEMRQKYPDQFDEEAMNGLGYVLLSVKRYDEAIKLFKLNVQAYPNSANVYDSLAEAYMRKGEVDLAIEYYTKTLEMIPKDPREDKDFLENLRRGATENLKKLEKRKSRQKK